MINSAINNYKLLHNQINMILPFMGLRIFNNNHKILKLFSLRTSLYEKSKFALEKFTEGSLTLDCWPCYYIYKIYGENCKVMSLVASIPYNKYTNSIIIPHEEILKDKQIEYANSFMKFKVQVSPIYLSHYHDLTIHKLLNLIVLNEKYCNYYFDVKHQITHCLWKISNPKKIDHITQAYKNISKLYIVDGHHRVASLYSIYGYNLNILSMISSHKFLNISSVNKENLKLVSHFKKLTINDVFYFANNGKLLPPKSTCFEPKPIDGFILSLF